MTDREMLIAERTELYREWQSGGPQWLPTIERSKVRRANLDRIIEIDALLADMVARPAQYRPIAR